MGFHDMEPVWVQYGSGIALGLGFGGLTHRTVRSVKVLGESGATQVWALYIAVWLTSFDQRLEKRKGLQ